MKNKDRGDINFFRWVLCGKKMREQFIELNKRTLLAEKEREDIKKKKNNTINEQKEELDSKSMLLKTKDTLLKKRDKSIYDLTQQLNDYKLKVADKDIELINLKNDNFEKEETIKTLKDKLELALKKIAFCKSHSRLPNVEELKAYTYGRKEVIKRIRKSDKKNEIMD